MLSVLRSAWRIVVRRLVADWFILAAAALTILLASVLLASGPIYTDSVTVSSARRSLADAKVTEANIEVSVRLLPDRYTEANGIVSNALIGAFELTGGNTGLRMTSQSFELPEQSSQDVVDITVFRFFQSLDSHAALVEGAWPGDSPLGIEAAISLPASERLGVGVGDQIDVTSRRDATESHLVTISGLYAVNDPDAAFWYDDELDTAGIQESASFRTIGPLVVDIRTMLSSLSTNGSDVSWRVFPSWTAVEVGDIAAMKSEITTLEARLDRTQAAAGANRLDFRVDTRATAILSDIERSLLATRSSVIALSIQLGLLAGYALVMTAGLLTESRRIETELLRSRGASRAQILALAIMEAMVIAVPAAVISPFIASRLLRVFNDVGPLASIDLVLDPRVTTAAFALSFAAAGACVVALALPARRAATAIENPYAARGRQHETGVLRGGADVVLFGFAALGFWQLRRSGSQLSESLSGSLDIDPLLVAAPAIGLLAGALLALRTVPLLARLAERIATGTSAVVGALSAWQVSRRPVRYARSSLLLIMAVAIGVFAASYNATWSASQDDQAAFQIGSDVRLQPDRLDTFAIADMFLDTAHRGVAGVVESMPVVRESADLARSAGTGRFLFIDAASAASVVEIRDDLVAGNFTEMMDRLVASRPRLASIPLAGSPQRIAIDISVDVEPLPDDFEQPEGVSLLQTILRPSVVIVVEDVKGLLWPIPLGSIEVDSGSVRLVADLFHTTEDATRVLPQYPLSIVDIEIVSPTPIVEARHARIEIGAVLTEQVGEQGRWSEMSPGPATEGWTLRLTRPSSLRQRPEFSFSSEQPTSGVAIDIDSGVMAGQFTIPARFSLRPAGTDLPETFASVVSTPFLEITGRSIGDESRIAGIRSPRQTIELIGSLDAFPTIDPRGGEAVIVDLPTFQAMSYETSASIEAIDERWIRVDTNPADVAETLNSAPFNSRALEHSSKRSDDLKTDPVALGTIGALSLGFIAATVVAAVGFAVSTAVSARERTTEFALLRAVGLSPRQLSSWLLIENGSLVILSLALGTGVGLLLAWLILPLVSITQDATVAVPEVLVTIPWATVALLELVVLAVLLVVVTVLTIALRRNGLGSLLRLGGD